MADSGNELEKLKRQAGDLVAELHARNLAIPAGLLVVLILVAVFVLPKSAAPPEPVNATPIVQNDDKKVELAKVANITVVDAVSLSEDKTPGYGQANPFKVGTDTTCQYKVGSSPREFRCIIGSTVVYYKCMPSDDGFGCTAPEGGTGSSGGTGTTQPTGGIPPTDDNGGNTEKKTKITYYTIDVTYDGKTYKGLEGGDQLPSSGTPIVFYAGPNSKASKALFVLGDNVTVQGAQADPDLGTFEISKGDEVVLTESNYQVHSLKLKKITKVTKTVTE